MVSSSSVVSSVSYSVVRPVVDSPGRSVRREAGCSGSVGGGQVADSVAAAVSVSSSITGTVGSCGFFFAVRMTRAMPKISTASISQSRTT